MLQRSDEWVTARIGKATASRMGDLTATTKSGYGASRGNYMGEIVAERLTGLPYPTFQSAAMARGTEKEPEGLNAYALLTGQDLIEVGFVPHPSIAMSGASPDRLIGDDGIVEIKCPNTITHINTIRGAEIDRDYRVQVQYQLACTGRDWCDWVSYDDRLPARQSIFVKRIYRDRKAIQWLENEAIKFLDEVEQAITDLQNMNNEDWLRQKLRASCETA
jgi:hypothetical protein